MILVSKKEHDDFDEVIIKEGLFKTTKVYRKYSGGTLLRFKEPNRYYTLTMLEHLTINRLFDLPDTK